MTKTNESFTGEVIWTINENGYRVKEIHHEDGRIDTVTYVDKFIENMDRHNRQSLDCLSIFLKTVFVSIWVFLGITIGIIFLK